MTKNLKKITAEKKFNFFFIKNYNIPVPRPSANKRGLLTLQNMNLKKKILLLWVIFALLDPDPLTRLNPDPIRIRNPALSLIIINNIKNLI